MKNAIIFSAFILGSILVTAQPNTPKPFRNYFFNVSKGNLWGYTDKTGKLRIPYKYEEAFMFFDGIAGAKLNGKWGYIDTLDHIVIPFIYDYAFTFKDGLAKVGIDGKLNFIDKKGKVVIKTDFLEFEVSDFSEGLCTVSLNRDRYGYMDTSGKMVTPIKYFQAGDFSEGLAPVSFYESFSVISWSTMKPLEGYPDNYDKRLPKGAGPAWKGKMTSGYMNKKGEVVLQGDYVAYAPFSEGMAAVKVNNQYGFIDKTGKVIIKPTYTLVGDFCEGLASVLMGDKYGFINKKGEVVIPVQFSYAGDFEEGLAVAEVNGLRGFINKKGEFAIPAKYKRAFAFVSGSAIVELNGRLLLVNTKGEVIGRQ